MKIRAKTLTIFVATGVLLFLVLHEVTFTIISNSYGQLETKDVAKTVDQIHGAVTREYSTLNSKLSDWAQWNDTYKFVEDNNSAYIADNLTPTTLYAFGLNFLLFVNSTGSLVYGLGLDLSKGTATQVPVPRGLVNLITSDGRFWNFRDLRSNFTGLVVLPEGPLMFSSQPILTSQGKGPINGAVIFGHYLDDRWVIGLSQTLRIPLSSKLYSAWQASGVVSSSVRVLPSTYVHPINAYSIDGYYVMNDISGRPAFVLGTTLPRDIYQEGLATVSYVDLGVIVACLIFSAATVLLLERVILSRLHKLASEVTSIGGKKNPSTRVSASGNDELSTLGGSINKMLGEIEKATVQLQKSERFSAIGELATMVAHDLRNPLQGIANAVFFLKRNHTTGGKAMEMLTVIEQDVKYSDKIVNDLLDYARDLRLELTETNPRQLVKQALTMVAVPENIDIKDETTDLPRLKVDVNKFTRTFANIISNAVDAMPNGGSLNIKTVRSERELDFIFADTGVGMTKEVLSRIFAPLFTTKAKGMGLGLSISKRIIEAHGGRISAESTPSLGTKFTISIPMIPNLQEVKIHEQ